jgi:putative GTP pyrophosphokinase
MSATTGQSDQLLKDYIAVRPVQEACTESFFNVVSALIRHQDIRVHQIEKRTKTVESFQEKANREDKHYLDLSQITDLTGIRIITFLHEEVEAVCKLIEEEFEVDWPNSGPRENKPDQFGYRSYHYIVSYNDKYLAIPLYGRFKGMKAEIQIRTALQHAWAAVDHRFRYKPEVDIPDSVRRRLFRISALLEAADEDFSRTSQAIAELQAKYEAQLNRGNLKIEINRESLELFVKSSTAIAALKEMSLQAGFHIAPPHPNSPNPLLNLSLTLQAAQVDSIAAFNEALERVAAGGATFLSSIHQRWRKPLGPQKLVVDLGGLLRLAVIESLPPAAAADVLRKVPFGPELHKAAEGHLAARTTQPAA